MHKTLTKTYDFVVVCWVVAKLLTLLNGCELNVTGKSVFGQRVSMKFHC